MNRFFVSPKNIGDKCLIIDKKDDVNHINKVLRLKVGDDIEVADGMKWEYIAEIISLNKDIVEGKIVDKNACAKEPDIDFTLFQGIPKKGKMDLIIQKNVEIGIKGIVPVKMDRSIGKLGEKSDKKRARYNGISESAAKQCKRGIIPEISPEMTFDEMMNHITDFDLIIFPYEGEENLTIKRYLQNENLSDKKIEKAAIMIGPEGGFSKNEVRKIEECGIRPVSLGKTILRTETAGMVALSMTMYELEM